MPCMGPSKDAAYKDGEQVFETFIAYLEKSNKIMSEKLADGKPNFLLKESWHKAKADLKVAIQELIWEDDCASF